LKDTDADYFILARIGASAYEDLIKLMQTSKRISTVADVLRKFRDDNVLELLESSKAFLVIIDDPFKAFQLQAKVPGNAGQEEFFKKLRLAAERDYANSAEVLRDLKDLNPYSKTVLDEWSTFRPYQNFIFKSGRALDLFNEIEKNPTLYRKFASNAKAMDNLKMQKVGLENYFEHSKAYLEYIRTGLDSTEEMLGELLKANVPAESATISNLKVWAIIQSLRTGRASVSPEVFEKYAKSPEISKRVFEVVQKNFQSHSRTESMHEFRPEFLNLS
jgi:hypothetical protein